MRVGPQVGLAGSAEARGAVMTGFCFHH
jgi:hypothetical protein